MLKIRGMDIYYIRGDDDSFTIQPVQADGTPITGYTGVFSIKRTYEYRLRPAMSDGRVRHRSDARKNPGPCLRRLCMGCTANVG